MSKFSTDLERLYRTNWENQMAERKNERRIEELEKEVELLWRCIEDLEK